MRRSETHSTAGKLSLATAIAAVMLACLPCPASHTDAQARRVIDKMIDAYTDGRYDDARSHGNTIRALEPAPSAKWRGYNEIWLGVTYEKMGDVQRAVNAFTQAIPYLGQATNETSGQTKGNVISYLGRAYRGLSEDWNTITPRQERLEEFAPKAIKHYRSSAQVLPQGDAQRDLADAAKLADRMVAYAREHRDAGRLQDALRVLGKLLEVDPTNAAALTLKQQIEDENEARAPEEVLADIRALLADGAHARALTAADEALEKWPNDPELIALKALALIGVDRPEDALAAIERAGQLTREMALAKADALFMLERWDEVITICDSVIRDPRASPEQREYAKNLKRRAEEEPDRPSDFSDARLQMESMLDGERYMQAAFKAKTLLQLYPDRPEAKCLAAIAYAHRSDTAKARTQIDAALRHREQLLSEAERAQQVFPAVEWALTEFAPGNDDATNLSIAVCGWLLLGDGARAGAACDRLDGRAPWNVDSQLLALLHLLWGASQHVAGVGSARNDQVDAAYGEKGPRFHLLRARALERGSVREDERMISQRADELISVLKLSDPDGG